MPFDVSRISLPEARPTSYAARRLVRELAKRTNSGLPGMIVEWFAWCNVRPTHLLNCASVRDGWCNARTVALDSFRPEARIEFFRGPLSAVQ
jgi:hypothetical protein